MPLFGRLWHLRHCDIGKKFEAFGWNVLAMDGGNMDEIIATLNQAKSACGKGAPTVIIMNTIMGNGVDFMMHSHKWHGIAPNDDQLANALGQLVSEEKDY